MKRPLLLLLHLLPDLVVDRSASRCWTPNGDIHALYGYANWGMRLRYVVIRSFPRSATADEIRNDPRIQDDYSDVVFIRDDSGGYRPVETDGRAYIFDGDALHAFPVTLTEAGDDLPLITAESTIAGLISAYRQFER